MWFRLALPLHRRSHLLFDDPPSSLRLHRRYRDASTRCDDFRFWVYSQLCARRLSPPLIHVISGPDLSSELTASFLHHHLMMYSHLQMILPLTTNGVTRGYQVRRLLQVRQSVRLLYSLLRYSLASSAVTMGRT